MRVEKGHSYIGAAKRPFFVSLKTIEEALINLGFSQVVVMDQTEWEQQYREKGGVPDVFTSLPGYQAHEWNTVARGVRTGETADVPIPVTPAWVLDLPPAAPGAGPGPLIEPSLPAPRPAQPAAPSSAASLPGWVGPVAVLGVGALGTLAAVVVVWKAVKKDDKTDEA